MERNIKGRDWYYLIPIMLIVAIVPLIVRLKIMLLQGDLFNYWTGQTEKLDFFSYYKAIVLLVMVSLSLVMICIKVYREGKDTLVKSYYYIPIGIYSFFIILSTMLSKHKEVALNGFVDRYEGMYVLLAYMIILFITINVIRNEKNVKIILAAISVLLIINCTIGLFQYIGYDLWNSTLGKHLMLGSKYGVYADKLDFKFQKYQIYSTLYHYNYVGSFTAMFFPMSLAILILARNKYIKLISALLAILSGINWIGSNARSGMIGVGIAFLVFVIMINRYILKNWKYVAIMLILIIFIAIGLNTYSKGTIYKRVNSLVKDIFTITNNAQVAEASNDNLPLKALNIKGNLAEITTPTEMLKVSYSNNQIFFFDESAKLLKVNFEKETGKITVLDEKYKDYVILVGDFFGNNTVRVVKGQLKLNLSLVNNSIVLVDNKGRKVSLDPVAKWGFEGKEKLGSSRGYIWSRSIPLLKNTIITGYGPDTFAIYFPQNDIMGKIYAYDGDMWQIIDKPHNLYLQTALNTGIISLLAMLVMFIMYFISSARLYINNNYDDFMSVIGVAVLVAVCGYLGAALFNDSVVSVAPVFWVIFGLGISVNYLVDKSRYANSK